MSLVHVVRVGALAQVGRFVSVDAIRHPRGARVIVRTSRGLEIGDVLAPPTDGDHCGGPTDGPILRRMTATDELLEVRLLKNRQQAFDACRALIAELSLPAVLVDVEHLFDGRSLVFYFLGEPPAELDELTADLAETYEANVQLRRFAETLMAGCGPGCGTESASGHGCGSCSTGCAVADACASRRH